MKEYTKQIWKDIPGYEGLYKVSDLGIIKSVDRLVNHGTKGFRKIKGTILKQSKNIKGYSLVGLSKEGKIKCFLVHQLVAMAFLNFKPKGNTLVVDHINNDKRLNCLSNLSVITNRQNVSKRTSIGSSKYTGVCWDKINKKWMASIMVNGKKTTIGRYFSEEEASQAYQNKLKEL